MAYNSEHLPEAENDLDEAIDWYANISAKVSQNFVDAYLLVFDQLTENPFQFPKVRGEVRKARFSDNFPFNIFFMVKGQTVVIVSVFHDKRNPEIWQERV